jgi:squalene cyclase
MAAYEVVNDDVRRSMIGSINRCVQFLLDSQFNDGSYGFKPEVRPFPDADDTSMVVAALLKYSNNIPNNINMIHKSISRPMRWLLKMQKSILKMLFNLHSLQMKF